MLYQVNKVINLKWVISNVTKFTFLPIFNLKMFKNYENFINEGLVISKVTISKCGIYGINSAQVFDRLIKTGLLIAKEPPVRTWLVYICQATKMRREELKWGIDVIILSLCTLTLTWVVTHQGNKFIQTYHVVGAQ